VVAAKQFAKRRHFLARFPAEAKFRAGIKIAKQQKVFLDPRIFAGFAARPGKQAAALDPQSSGASAQGTHQSP
jgi:hypothetical protein